MKLNTLQYLIRSPRLVYVLLNSPHQKTSPISVDSTILTLHFLLKPAVLSPNPTISAGWKPHFPKYFIYHMPNKIYQMKASDSFPYICHLSYHIHTYIHICISIYIYKYRYTYPHKLVLESCSPNSHWHHAGQLRARSHRGASSSQARLCLEPFRGPLWEVTGRQGKYIKLVMMVVMVSEYDI